MSMSSLELENWLGNLADDPEALKGLLLELGTKRYSVEQFRKDVKAFHEST